MVDGPGREQLEALLALQYAETTIRRLGRRLDELPEQAALSAARARGMAVNAERDAVRVEMEDIESDIGKLEGELALLQTAP